MDGGGLVFSFFPRWRAVAFSLLDLFGNQNVVLTSLSFKDYGVWGNPFCFHAVVMRPFL